VFDEIILLEVDNLPALVWSSLRVLKRLFGYDTIIDLEIHSRLSVIFMLLTCARNRIGFYTDISYWRCHLNTHLLYYNPAGGVYYFYDQIVRLFSVQALSLPDSRKVFRQNLGLAVEPAGTREAEPYRLGIGSCCSELGNVRKLTPAQWGEVLSQALMGQSAQALEIVLLGGKADAEFCQSVVTVLESALQKRFPGLSVKNQAGRLSMRDSILTISTCARFLCIDSGLLHLSRLLGIPTESYWGATSPELMLREIDPHIDQIHYARLPCSPCIHVTSTPPCGGNNVCMQRLTASGQSVESNPGWVIIS
jgi:ADP-heptose:LPS heptosyltransferase